ncbi:MAG: hypothetical protein OXC40_03875 [Proteobacteria bacterium]|nr:hypothetical protein [Pseudomonadota bacterium]
MTIYWYFTCSSLFFHILTTVSDVRHTDTREEPRHLPQIYTALAGLSLFSWCLYKLVVHQSLMSWLLLLALILSAFSLFKGASLGQKISAMYLSPGCMILISGDMIRQNMFLNTPPLHFFRDFHIVFATLGQGAAIVTVVFAVIITLKQRELKAKNVTFFAGNNKPPLETLTAGFYESLQAGVVCLSLALISGVVFSSSQLTELAQGGQFDRAVIKFI